MDAGEREVRERLREAARTHTPDRERMRARVDRGMSAPGDASSPGPRRPAPQWLRVAGATVAVAAVLAAGGYGVAGAVRTDEPPQRTVATDPAPDRAAAGEPVWADGSIDPGSSAYWSQSNVTVKVRRPLTALTVEVRLDARDAPRDTGSWRTLPAEDFTVTVRKTEGGGLLYRWTLKEGRTVPVGAHVFAAQYDHAEGGRDAHGDTYAIRAETHDGADDGADGRADGKAEQHVWKGDFA
ncbi:hypothetical protein RCO28_22505 [Streptomyces sp. LHD-70]|uniref:hypothetical protein n=1 Tax=Streptomyces sp. LHD-70 TaxID=3072140 RepID=UPI00280DF2C1|nr:hypothetical protein [Streptomyces sp. LHD-70]MDQ8705246.1 hypothetical protein [Streptomyces sp. LHD-70]